MNNTVRAHLWLAHFFIPRDVATRIREGWPRLCTLGSTQDGPFGRVRIKAMGVGPLRLLILDMGQVCEGRSSLFGG